MNEGEGSELCPGLIKTQGIHLRINIHSWMSCHKVAERKWHSLPKHRVGKQVYIFPYTTTFPFSFTDYARAVQQCVYVCVCLQICITELVIVTYCGYLQSPRAMLCPWWQCVCVCQMEGCSCQLSASVVMKRDWKSSSPSLLSLSPHYVQLQMTF